ncbi:hypothetical protein BDQ12DRAFT_724603 [Crucibulum laeve]|uniref:Uncharacterized protein n=1 Tax=Crucibulum laeve TaxID=68775 RepID=A0A5C3LVX3_9AGAR|nr:hypothetical protein BDQ12DRAFT_724603 [Crucibulum laeve]
MSSLSPQLQHSLLTPAKQAPSMPSSASTLDLSAANAPIATSTPVPTPVKSTAAHPHLHLQCQHGQCECSGSCPPPPSMPAQQMPHPHLIPSINTSKPGTVNISARLHLQCMHSQCPHYYLNASAAHPHLLYARSCPPPPPLCTQLPTPTSTFDTSMHLCTSQ